MLKIFTKAPKRWQGSKDSPGRSWGRANFEGRAEPELLRFQDSRRSRPQPWAPVFDRLFRVSKGGRILRSPELRNLIGSSSATRWDLSARKSQKWTHSRGRVERDARPRPGPWGEGPGGHTCGPAPLGTCHQVLKSSPRTQCCEFILSDTKQVVCPSVR